MRIRQIDFPPAVIEAQRSGRLVLFAGAGVSIDPPSNYPDFKALASEVGGALHPRYEGEAIDVYLGRLKASGIRVHEQVRQILSSPNSRPNANHTALTGLFKDPKCCQLVTTNFDRHFTTAAADRFGKNIPEVFYAPALPIGSDFTGIVNLHGSVDREPHRMVLTDSDFGRAYITEGWATRFLERLFSQFVVLFVGYSHEDMLLSYLARGLTSGSVGPRRFAVTPPDDDARWKNLGIVPVHYSVSEPPESRHGQLTIALTAWAEQSQAGALAVEQRIRTIVSAGTAIGHEEDDFLKGALSDISTLRFFTRHARGPQWLRWAEVQPQFQRIFSMSTNYSEADYELASWFARQFAIQHINEALDLVRRRGEALSPLIWQEISLVLFRGKVHGESLSKWVTILVTTAIPSYRNDVLEYVISHCTFPDDQAPALLLFEHLTRPRINLKASLSWSGEDVQPNEAIEVEIDCVGSEHWLRQVWNNMFLPHLDVLARQIASIVSSHLTTARRLLVGFGKDKSFDPLSLSRGMVESREQDHLRNGFSVVIDAAAGVLKWAAEHDPDWANALITDWFGSDAPLLRRLAIFGTAISTHISADAKLRWVAQSGLLLTLGFKHELFLLIERAYPQSSLEARDDFLEEVERQYKSGKKNPEIAAYEFFNIVGWIAKSDPGCKLASKLFVRLKQENPTFGERTHPDMDSWVGPASFGQWDSPVSSAELLTYELEKLLEKLQTTKESFYPGAHSKEGLLQMIGQCAQSSHDWGLGIARQAQERSIWLNEVWQPLLRAWAATQLTEQQWVAVLDVLKASAPMYKSALRSLAWFLERGISSASAAIPGNLIPGAKSIADQLWAYVEDEEEEQITGDIDWLGRAINHPAGQLFEFYLHSLGRVQQQENIPEHRLEQYKPIFTAALTGAHRGAQLARVVLASQLHFLFHIDASWTVENVFPILDGELDEDRARQCWHGYLYWGRWTDSMLVKLMHSYESMFPLIDNEKDEIRRIFCGHLSGIAVYSSVHPLENGWLLQFLLRVKLETRALWAGEFRRVITALDNEAKLHLWRRWLKKYWGERLQGRPLPLDGKEVAEMIEWVVDLGPLVPEAVMLLRSGPYPDSGQSMVYYPLSESELLKQYPDAFADLLVFLASGDGARPIYDLDKLYSAVEQLVSLIPRNPQLLVLCDELARLGVPEVSGLAGKLDPSYTVV